MKNIRKPSGIMGSYFITGAILVGALLGCMGTDFAHIAAVQEELQNAADAAALAGAQDLWTSPQNAESNARAVLAENTADGRKLEDANLVSSDVIVTPPQPPLQGGQVEVRLRFQIRNVMAPLIGRYFETLNARAVAGTAATIQTVFANQVFPLGVDPFLVPPAAIGEEAIANKQIGDTVTLYINSQQWKNAAWTSLKYKPASNAYIDRAVEGLLGLEPLEPGYISAIDIGDKINLNNGVISEKSLARGDERAALLDPTRPPLTFPLISSQGKFNQDAEVVGFISIRPTNITTGGGGGVVQTIVGRIVAAQLRGIGTNASGPLSQIQPGPIQLIE